MADHENKPSFIGTLIMAAAMGALIGIKDLWAFEKSVKSFSSGVAAGVTFSVSFSVINYFLPKGLLFVQRLAWYSSGGFAGLVWWLVVKLAEIQMWVAVIAGVVIAIIWWFAENRSTKRKNSASNLSFQREGQYRAALRVRQFCV